MEVLGAVVKVVLEDALVPSKEGSDVWDAVGGDSMLMAVSVNGRDGRAKRRQLRQAVRTRTSTLLLELTQGDISVICITAAGPQNCGIGATMMAP